MRRWPSRNHRRSLQQPVYQQPPPPPPAAGGISNEALEQLKQLGALKDQGILTEQEFGVQKAKILGM